MSNEITVREAAQRKQPLDGASAFALEAHLQDAEKEITSLRRSVEYLVRERDYFKARVLPAEICRLLDAAQAANDVGDNAEEVILFPEERAALEVILDWWRNRKEQS